MGSKDYLGIVAVICFYSVNMVASLQAALKVSFLISPKVLDIFIGLLLDIFIAVKTY